MLGNRTDKFSPRGSVGTVTTTIKQISVGGMDNNVYLVSDSAGRTLLIDAANEAERITIPVVAFGVDADAREAAAAIKAGAKEFIPLPPDAELIAAVAKDAGVSQADAGKVLTAIVENIHSTLKSGGDIRISNLGVFDTADRAEREGRNPATGATIKIAASKAVRFRVSKPLKDAVNG